MHRQLCNLVASLAWILLAVPRIASQTLPTPVICEDSLDGQPPFNANLVPCLLNCGLPRVVPTLSFLPGSVNESAIPYCQLDCVRPDADAVMSAAAPGCYRACGARNQATPENVGWCMYWCVGGGALATLVPATACVPSLEYGPPVTTSIDGMPVTVRPFTQPPEWVSWYETQTVIPRTGSTGPITAPPSATTTEAPSSSTLSGSQLSLSGSSQTKTSSVGGGTNTLSAGVSQSPSSATGSSSAAGLPSPDLYHTWLLAAHCILATMFIL